MKKLRKLSLILVLVLLMQCLCPVAWATEVEDSQASESVAAESGAAEESAGDETAESSAEDTIPQNISGDASVNSGCNSINAQNPLVNNSELVVEGNAALMYELTTDTLLYAYNPDAKMYPASLTKVMTCLLALEYGDMDQIVTVSSSALSGMDPSGSTCDLVVGEEIPMKELVYCLLVASANDAAAVISETVAGSEEAFVALMNQKASELGCTNTNFVNPHGLHDDNHYTTARDMAKILMAALEYDLFREVYSTTEHEVPATNMSDARTIYTTNYMISTAIVETYYDSRVIGGKTGFTTPAGRCLVAVAEDNGMQLLTVFMGGKTEEDVENGGYSYGSFEETSEMLDYGFDKFTAGQILSADEVLTSLTVSGAEHNTQAYVKEAATTALPSGFTFDQLRYEYLLDDGTLTAPVYAGQALGVVRVWYQSRCLAQREIYATVDAEVKQTEPENTKRGLTSGAGSDFLQIVLTVILVLLGLILVMVLITMIRNAFIRARRKRRRRSRRRSR